MRKTKAPLKSGRKDDMIAGQESRSESTPLVATQHGDAKPEARIDLERLVWDPEYRKAVRHLLDREE
ncbi:hypothetical protein HBA54_00470 [Pelagibius litoralis]|uniref:Uncharacterized protein n=1 Tax=Pelagibius litoralis TaxID=374515 RepID=A0A967C2H2_9PROT|nr:hypothetical protein [Pelagibius litoralis]NIA67060.1 hypothetical protein [Pelagibius litoralis]